MEEPVAATVHLHGRDYSVNISTQTNQAVLEVCIEEEDTGCFWGETFSASYVEDITKQTGNAKRFPIFVQMLLSAINQSSESVFIDLLTYADLEKYKSRRYPAEVEEEPKVTQARESKRYLILTYSVEYDRVHYPLPLKPITNPTVHMLQRTVSRLREALADNNNNNLTTTKNSSTQLQALRNENHELSLCYQKLRAESAREIKKLREGRGMSEEPLRHKVKLLQAQLTSETAERESELRQFKQTQAEYMKTISELKEMLNSTQLKNRELMRQLALLRSAPKKTEAVVSDTEVVGRGPTTNRSRTAVKKKKVAPLPPKTRPRFDPTAYVKEQKRRGRAVRSPKPDRSPSRRYSVSPDRSGYVSTSSERSDVSLTRRRREKNNISNYSSDSDRSEIPRRSRSRDRASAQRELDARLSSPKAMRWRSPSPSGFSRSPSPHRRARVSSSPQRSRVSYSPQRRRHREDRVSYSPKRQSSPMPPPPLPIEHRISRISLNSSSSTTTSEKVPKKHHQSFYNTSESSASPERFVEGKVGNVTQDVLSSVYHEAESSVKRPETKLPDLSAITDIGSRLDALQGFLREAKKGTTTI